MPTVFEPSRGLLRYGWRGQYLLPHRVGSLMADMLRGQAVMADAASQFTGDARWQRLADRFRAAAQSIEARETRDEP